MDELPSSLAAGKDARATVVRASPAFVALAKQDLAVEEEARGRVHFHLAIAIHGHCGQYCALWHDEGIF